MMLDLRPLPAKERAPALLSAYGALEPAQSLYLLSDNGEAALLSLLQEHHAGEFEWHTLVQEPANWQMVVVRRSSSASTRRKVLEFMVEDHRRFYDMLEEVLAAAESGDAAAAARQLEQLAIGLHKHVRMEEEVLLPLVAERLVSPRGPAAVLADDHRRIGERVETLVNQARQPGDDRPAWSERFCEEVEQFRRFLTNHTGMEERILYVVADLILADDERDALIRRCQAVEATED